MTRKAWTRRSKNPDQPTAGHKARNIFLVAAVAALSTVGTIAIASSAESAAVKITICHRTNSNSNPYVEISPSASGVTHGHEKHTGPIWDPTLKSQHIKWGDIIPPFGAFAGQNWSDEGQQILANGCNIPATAIPGDLGVNQSVCAGNPSLPTVPSVTFPSTPGVTYSISPAPVAGGSSTVTATANAPGTMFVPPAPAGWTFVDITHETQVVDFDAAPLCSVTVVPQNPTVTQSVCNSDSNPTVPDVTFATTAGITYSISPAPAAGGSSTVTATATAGNVFVAPAPAGWTFVDVTHETFAISFDDAPDCTAPAGVVAPVNPAAVNSICNTSTGAVSAPTLTLASGPAGVTYTVSAAAPFAAGQSVTVTATADGTHMFVAPANPGWTIVDANHETFGVAFAAAPKCGATSPLANTGAASGKLMTIGGIALVLGLAMQFMGSRRRRATA